MDYGKILSRAWQITWRWKMLWILGFLAALGSGSGGGGGGSSYSDKGGEWGHAFEQGISGEMWGVIAAVACLAILIGIALWVVSVIARGGLIAGVQQIEEEETFRLGDAWRAGVKRFWTLFGISILATLPVLIPVVIGVAILVLFFAGAASASGVSVEAGETMTVLFSILCGGTLCCLGVVAAIVLEQIRKYAERAAVLEGLGWIDAFKRGWQVLKENLGPTVIFWLIFLVIGLIIGLVVFGGMLVLITPLAAIFSATEPRPWLILPICGGGLLLFIVGGLIGAIVETFTSATWTLVYRQMTGLAAQPTAQTVAEG